VFVVVIVVVVVVVAVVVGNSDAWAIAHAMSYFTPPIHEISGTACVASVIPSGRITCVNYEKLHIWQVRSGSRNTISGTSLMFELLSHVCIYISSRPI
jgi:hypothetical protein